MQITVQKYSFDVQLMYIPTMMSCQCTNAMNGGHTTNGSKGLIKINALLLSITLCYKPGLIAIINATITRLRFSLYTHLVPIAFLSGGKSHKDHVPFFTIASYSTPIAAIQFFECYASSNKTSSSSSYILAKQSDAYDAC